MRWRMIVLTLLGFLHAGFALGDGFPYVAYVNSTDVYVRSGPGRDYYPTNKLHKGEQIEVYRHDPGGWLAIRPPRDSYSWVSARHLDMAEGKLAKVNSDRVVARVGSSFSEVRDVIQVRLDRDEVVELLEIPASDSPWCKVSPPSGEFRWIFSKYVDRDLPNDLAQDEHEADTSKRRFSSDDEHSRDDEFSRREEADSYSTSGVQLTGANDPPSTPMRANGITPSDPVLADELARLRTLERIDMELSEIVAEDITQWSFTELQHRADTALQTAQSSLERGRARVLLDKLDRFEDIKRRHDSLRSDGSALAAAPAAAPIAIPTTDSRFDGVGRLQPVVSQNTGGPQFALLDGAGAVLSFVTPAPGVNLRPYVDKYIGVNGQRGYLTDLQRQHVSVQRVTLLDAQRR